MDLIEQENQSLKEEVATLREGMDRLTTMMNALLSAQNSQAATAVVDQPFMPPG